MYNEINLFLFLSIRLRSAVFGGCQQQEQEEQQHQEDRISADRASPQVRPLPQSEQLRPRKADSIIVLS